MGGSVRFAGHNFQRSLVFCFVFLFFLWVSDGRGGTERTETIIPITNYVSLFVLSSIARDKKSIGGGSEINQMFAYTRSNSSVLPSKKTSPDKHNSSRLTMFSKEEWNVDTESIPLFKLFRFSHSWRSGND